jgi:OOP family OmpA-OmpF porin
MKNDAYEIYWACRTAEGIAMANEAAARANALCPRRVEAPQPAPVAVAPLPAGPTVSMSANPATVEQGQCSMLAWSTTGASSASIEGIGGVDPSGSRQVCPGSTTQYTITAMGDGGTRTASTTVAVNPPAVKAEPKVIDRLVLHVNFDFDKSFVRKADVAELQKAIDFVKKYPGYEIAIEGHTDSRGSVKYNQALSERRAAAVKAYLLKNGMIDTQKNMITTKGYGKSKPIADNKTDKGRFENRRVEILVLER